jgi:hypothetical protein
MKVLVACEFSARTRDAFRRLGHEAWSCDLLPTEGDPTWHFQGDARELLVPDYWDLLIAHPPCTRLANSGLHWIKRRGLWIEYQEAVEFFLQFLNAPIPRRCIENPIMHGYAQAAINRPYDQIIHPWQFGHGEQKSTCLWLEGLPQLTPTQIVPGREQLVHKASESDHRWMDRSRTYEGVSEAMAVQWGGVI